jgi:LPXTG-motif cell wall-anchored protein
MPRIRTTRSPASRLARVLAAVAFLCVVWFAQAEAPAHQGDPNYRSELSGVSPAGLAGGLDFSVGNYDDFIALSNRSGLAVVIEGYRGEPYLRFLPNGIVQANTRSPAWFANRDRYAETSIPERADPDARPRWKTVSEEGRYAWHDHRSHWMGKGDPPQVEDRSVRTEIFDYSIPIRVDDRPGALRGTLFWVGSGGGPEVWPFLLLGGIAVGGAGWVLLRRRRDPGQSGAEDGERRIGS